MHANRMAWIVGVAILGSFAPGWAATDDPPAADQVVWRCWWDRSTHVSCTIEQLPAARPVEPLSPALPPFVAMLRARPQDLRERFVHIPLYTQPFEVESLSMLAQAVMCGSQRACRVHFSADVPLAAELDRLTDPVLASGG